MNDNTQQNTIDIKEIFAKIKLHKVTLAKTVTLAFIISALWIIPQPRTYTSTVTLAPEMSNIAGGGALGNIASSFGIDIGSMQTADAIYPTLYPDVLESTTFVTGLFNIKVQNADNSINTTYYDYLDKHQKVSFWMMPIGWGFKQLDNIFSDNESTKPLSSDKSKGAVPSIFTKREHTIINMIRNKINCSLDKKTDVISISVTDQDKLICATMADTVSKKLQDYITNYRTKKARVDVDYYENLLVKARAEYEKALGKYSHFSDSHMLSTIETVSSQKSSLYNDVQSKLASLNTITAQLQQAKAKLQEKTPSFTVIQCATVPEKPSGPKRLLFILGMMVLSAFGCVIYILRKDLSAFQK